jgi:hypothetical protein
VSAYNGENVEEAFSYLVKEIYKKHQTSEPKVESSTFKLVPPAKGTKE